MDIALLNTKITIQKNAVVTDSIGNHTNVWTDLIPVTPPSAVKTEAPKAARIRKPGRSPTTPALTSPSVTARRFPL